MTSKDRKSLAVVASESLFVNDDKSSRSSSGRMFGGNSSMAFTLAADRSDSDGLNGDDSRLHDEMESGGDDDE